MLRQELNTGYLSLPDKLSRIAKVRAPLPCSDCIALRKGVGTPMSREGSSALSARPPSAGIFGSTSSSFLGALIRAHFRCP